MPLLLPNLMDRIVERFAEGPVRGYVHIANVNGLTSALPFAISEDITIRRAAPSEVEEIRSAIAMYHPRRPRNPYETAIAGRHPLPSGGGEGYVISPLPEAQWSYTVIEHTGGNIRTHALAESSLLTFWPIDLGFGAGNGGGAPGFGTGPGLDVILESFEPDELIQTLDAERLAVLRATFRAWVKYPHEPLELRRAVRELDELRHLRRNTALRFLGLFAILESIVTHDPKPSDPGDSVTRQVVKKMNLLGRRFEFSLPYVEYFGAVPAETIWKKLYEARSSVAHGATPDFTKALAVLKNQEHASKFAFLAVTAVLRQALAEPQLLFDLREC